MPESTASLRDLLDGATWWDPADYWNGAAWSPPERRAPEQVQAEQREHQRWVEAVRRRG